MLPSLRHPTRNLAALWFALSLVGCSRPAAPVSVEPNPNAGKLAQPSKTVVASPARHRPAPAREPVPPPSPAPQPMPRPVHHHSVSGKGLPGPARSVAPVPPHPAATTAAENDEYAQGEELEAWKKTLRDGSIEYRVPAEMTAHQASTVTVNVHGFADQGSVAMPDRTGGGTLQVSQFMKVELLAPLSPDEFTLTPQQDAVQFVPNGSYATWVWNVTPVNEARHQQLLIRVSVVHRTAQSQQAEFLVSNQYPVDVGVQKVRVTLRNNFYSNPIAWFQYLSPTGKFWSAIGAAMSALGITGWIANKLNKRKGGAS